MTTTPTAGQLTKGTLVRFQNSVMSSRKLTVRLDTDADVGTTEGGTTYAVMTGYRVRPAEHNVSFGLRKVYCVNVTRIEIVKEV